jgi:hypoxanthine phosphoribosyltransferase
MQSLIDERAIRTAVDRLAAQIASDYAGRPLSVLGVLTGSIIFLSDVIRRIDLPLRVGLIQASSYRGRTTAAGELTVNSSLVPDISGRDVLLLDDIFDTGRTLAALVERIRAMRPASLRSAVLLWKEGRGEVELAPDYHCFRIPDVFVVGYGLDYNDEHRHLPYIAALDAADL